jgi:hypothetical protein
MENEEEEELDLQERAKEDAEQDREEEDQERKTPLPLVENGPRLSTEGREVQNERFSASRKPLHSQTELDDNHDEGELG